MEGIALCAAWARWTMVALASLVLCAICVSAFWVLPGDRESLPFKCIVLGGGVLLASVVLYVLLSAPSGRVFTREYRTVVELTRDIEF